MANPLYNQDPSVGGIKHDAGKIPLELVSPHLIWGVGAVMGWGASKKYPPFNWAKGMSWMRCVGATMRHLLAWMAGEDKDPESGYSHLWHAACMLSFLISYEVEGLGADDRYFWKARATAAPALPEQDKPLPHTHTLPASETGRGQAGPAVAHCIERCQRPDLPVWTWAHLNDHS